MMPSTIDPPKHLGLGAGRPAGSVPERHRRDHRCHDHQSLHDWHYTGLASRDHHGQRADVHGVL